jgi:catechol 2,3-dioxygenase-like lactoylglutathione lyase family enzyme
MDNVLIVVDDLEAAKAFFIELGMELEGETTVEGPLIGNLIGLKDVRATLAMMRTPDGQVGIELDKFHTPNPVRFGPVDAPVNTLGYCRVPVQHERHRRSVHVKRDSGIDSRPPIQTSSSGGP